MQSRQDDLELVGKTISTVLHNNPRPFRMMTPLEKMIIIEVVGILDDKKMSELYDANRTNRTDIVRDLIAMAMRTRDVIDNLECPIWEETETVTHIEEDEDNETDYGDDIIEY